MATAPAARRPAAKKAAAKRTPAKKAAAKKTTTPRKRAPAKKKPPTPVLDALNHAVSKSTHLDKVADAPAIEAARALARKIDLQDEYFAALAKAATEANGRPPSQDNVSIPTFLKYCESLGLTPAGRGRIGDQPQKGPGGGGKLGKLQSLAGGKIA